MHSTAKHSKLANVHCNSACFHLSLTSHHALLFPRPQFSFNNVAPDDQIEFFVYGAPSFIINGHSGLHCTHPATARALSPHLPSALPPHCCLPTQTTTA